VKRGVVIGWLCAAVLAGGVARPALFRRQPPAVPIFLEVSASTARSEHRDESPPGSGAGIAMALNGMSEERRKEIAEVLGALADQIERRHNPLVEDLDDDARPAAERVLREEQPALTAASALAKGRWMAPDGSSVVRATSTCAPGARCFPLTPDGGDGVDDGEAQARFLAWPIAYGVILRATPDEGDRVLGALRAGAPSPRIALALGDGDRGRLRHSEALGDLASSADRIARSESDDPLVVFLRRLSASDRRGGGLAWLSLPPGSILVVPRLSALASIGAFVSEVRERVASTRVAVEWLYQPRAM
jgi:hypothetical protein